MRRQYLSSWRIRSGKQDGAHSAERCNRERQPPRSHHLIQPSQQRHRGKCTYISPSPYSSFLHSSLDIQNVKSLFTAERERVTPAEGQRMSLRQGMESGRSFSFSRGFHHSSHRLPRPPPLLARVTTCWLLLIPLICNLKISFFPLPMILPLCNLPKLDTNDKVNDEEVLLLLV